MTDVHTLTHSHTHNLDFEYYLYRGYETGNVFIVIDFCDRTEKTLSFQYTDIENPSLYE